MIKSAVDADITGELLDRAKLYLETLLAKGEEARMGGENVMAHGSGRWVRSSNTRSWTYAVVVALAIYLPSTYSLTALFYHLIDLTYHHLIPLSPALTWTRSQTMRTKTTCSTTTASPEGQGSHPGMSSYLLIFLPTDFLILISSYFVIFLSLDL